MQSLKDIVLENKRVLVRTGFDVPIEDGKILDRYRLVAGLPTLRHLLMNNCRITLIFHIGRPGGKVVPELSVGPVVAELKRLLGVQIRYQGFDKQKQGVHLPQEKEILILENLRFDPREEKDARDFAAWLVHLAQAEVFVQDAFCVLHRKHASVVGIPQFCLEQKKPIPYVVGFLVEKEVRELSKAKDYPQKPALAIIGGAKIETKIPVIQNLLKGNFQKALLGGMVANNFLYASGQKVKASELAKELITQCKKMISVFGKRIVLPQDFVWNNQNQIFDIGPQTIRLYQEEIGQAKTIIWNGPMGVFEQEEYAQGTKEVAQAIVKSEAQNVVGGGDTVFALQKYKFLEKFDFVSTGGGVMLKFLADQELPGLKILARRS